MGTSKLSAEEEPGTEEVWGEQAASHSPNSFTYRPACWANGGSSRTAHLASGAADSKPYAIRHPWPSSQTACS